MILAAFSLASLPTAVAAQTRDDVINDAVYSYAYFGCSALFILGERDDLSKQAIDVGIKLGRSALDGIEQGLIEPLEQALLLPMSFMINGGHGQDFQLGRIAEEAMQSTLRNHAAPEGVVQVLAGVEIIEVDCARL
ncbi:MAG: hypothetical protein RIB57_03170 [Pelagibacterium sp.]